MRHINVKSFSKPSRKKKLINMTFCTAFVPFRCTRSCYSRSIYFVSSALARSTMSSVRGNDLRRAHSFEVFAYVLFIPRPAHPGPHHDRILVLCRLVRAQGIQEDPPRVMLPTPEFSRGNLQKGC